MHPIEQSLSLLKARQFRYGAGLKHPDPKAKGVAGTMKREDFVKPGPMPGFVYLRNIGEGNHLMYDQPVAGKGDKMVSESEAEAYWPSHISQRTFMAPTMRGLGLDADAAAFRMENMRYAPPDTDFREQETVDRFASYMAPTMAHETMHGLDSDLSQGSFDQIELPAHILEVATREAEKAREGRFEPEPIIPKASQLLANRPESGQPPNPDYEFDLTSEPIVTGEPMDIAFQLLKSEVLLWPKRFDNKHFMMQKPGPGGFTMKDKTGKHRAFVSLPNQGGDYGKDVHSMTDEELLNSFMETDAHETMHETLGNIGEDYDKPLHNEYPAMVAEYLQYARRPREQIPSNDKVSQLLDEGMDDREIAMQIAQRMAPMHQQVSPGHNIGNIARVVTGSPNESYDDIQNGEPMDIAMRLLKGEYEDIPKEEHQNYYAGSLNALPGHKPGCDLRLNGYYPHYSASKYSGKCTCEAQCANCGAKEKWGYPHNDTDLCFDCSENMAGQGVIDDPLMNWMHSQPDGMPLPKTDDEDWRSNIETGEPMDIATQLLKARVYDVGGRELPETQTTLTGQSIAERARALAKPPPSSRAPKQHTGLNYHVTIPKQDLANPLNSRRYAIRRGDTDEIVGSLPMNPTYGPPKPEFTGSGTEDDPFTTDSLDEPLPRETSSITFTGDYKPSYSNIDPEHRGQNLYARALMGLLSAGDAGAPIVSTERNAASEGAHRSLMDMYSRAGGNLESLTGYEPASESDAVRYNQIFDDGYGSLRTFDPGGLPVRVIDAPSKRSGMDLAQTDLEDFGLEV